MAKNRTAIAADSDVQRYKKRSLPTSKPKRSKRKATNNLVESCNGMRGPGEGVNILYSSGKVRTKYHKQQSATQIATKCQTIKHSSNQNPGPIYESELERTLRLKLAKLKPTHEKQIGSRRSATTLINCSLRQISAFSRTTNASNPCSDSNLKVSPLASKNGDKLHSLVNNLKPSKPKAVHVWKFNDGTMVKKVY